MLTNTKKNRHIEKVFCSVLLIPQLICRCWFLLSLCAHFLHDSTVRVKRHSSQNKWMYAMSGSLFLFSFLLKYNIRRKCNTSCIAILLQLALAKVTCQKKWNPLSSSHAPQNIYHTIICILRVMNIRVRIFR